MNVILTPTQLQIVRDASNVCAISGLPGTGKTTTILWRFIQETERTPVDRILVLVRNYAAANNMVAGLRENLVPLRSSVQNLSIFTFRAFAEHQVLHAYQDMGWDTSPVVLDADVDWDIKRRALLNVSELSGWLRYGPYTSQPWFRKEVFDRALRISENVLDADDLLLKEMFLPGELGWQEVDKFIRDLHHRLRQDAIIAQSDVLHAFQQLLDNPGILSALQSRYDALIVDDAEDNIPLANEFIERFTGSFSRGRTLIAGDPYGSIRHKLGAEPSWFADLLNRVPYVNLNRNYQVGKVIGEAALALTPAVPPAQEWSDSVVSRIELPPLAPTYEDMLDQVADTVERERAACSPATPLALVVPDLADEIVVERLRALLAARDIPVSVLYGSRRVIDDPYGRAAFTLCQFLWPQHFSQPTVADLCSLLGTLFTCPADLLLHLHNEIDDKLITYQALTETLSPWRSGFTSLDQFLTCCEELRGMEEPLPILIQQVSDRMVQLVINANPNLSLLDKRTIMASLENLVDASKRYLSQVERLDEISDPGQAFSEALGDPGFAPLSQKTSDIPSGILLTTPMKLLELGWLLHGLVFVDFSDDTWIHSDRRFLSDARLLWRGWNGTDISPPEAREDAVRQVCTVLRKLILQAQHVVCLATSALTRTGEPAQGFRLHAALKQTVINRGEE